MRFILAIIKLFVRPYHPPISTSGVRSVLVVDPNHLGDMIMSSPLYRILKERIPDARVDALLYPFSKIALAGNPSIDTIHDLPRASLLKQLPVLLRLRKSRYDLVLQPNTSLRNNILMFVIGGRYRIGYDYADRACFNNVRIPIATRTARTRYRVDESIDLLEHVFGWKIADRHLDFVVSPRDRDKADAVWAQHRLERAPVVFAVHPHFRRTWEGEPEWSPEKFASLLSELIQRYDASCVLTGSDDDREYAESILGSVSRHEKIVNVVGQLSLHEAAALYRKVQLLISVNTGPVHAAIALNVPVVVLIRATPPFITLPSNNPRVRFAEGARAKPYDPYGLDYEYGSSIDEIQVVEVVDVVDSLLKSL